MRTPSVVAATRFDSPSRAGRLPAGPLRAEGRSGDPREGRVARAQISLGRDGSALAARFKAQAGPLAVARLDFACEWVEGRQIPRSASLRELFGSELWRSWIEAARGELGAAVGASGFSDELLADEAFGSALLDAARRLDASSSVGG